MATQGTTNGGLDDVSALAYVSGALTLIGYTNAADSLSATTVAADLTQPNSTNGYAPITLDGTWTSVNGILTYVHSAGPNNFGGNPGWQASGSWSGIVIGVAIIRGSVCRHFKDLSEPFTAANLRKLVVDLASVLA